MLQVVADRNFPDFGAQHFVDPSDPPKRSIRVVSGPDTEDPIDGYRMVASWSPATAPHRLRKYRQTLMVIPVEPVAVYVFETSRSARSERPDER